MNDTHTLILIIIMALITMSLRMLPFAIFNGKDTPKYISYLGKYLPYSIIGMLVIYCIKDVSVVKAPFGLPEFIAIAVVAVLHAVRRNTLLSILAGTIFYMILIQFVF